MTNYAPEQDYNSAMDIIYIDRLIILNLILDYLLVLCSARLCGIRLRPLRYFLAAIFGAVYAAGCIFPSLGFLARAPVKAAAGAAMALIAYGGEEKWLRCCLTFFASAALFGGAVWAISAQSGSYGISTLYVPVSMPVLVLSFACIYAILSFVFRRSVKSADLCVFDAKLSFMGKSIYLRCLHDSGNSLVDPISGDSVLVISADKAAPLFPVCPDMLKRADCTGLVALPGLEGRLRLIPYSAVGTGAGLLAAFRPDSISIAGTERSDIIVAISPTPIGGDGFDSLIG